MFVSINYRKICAEIKKEISQLIANWIFKIDIFLL